MTAINIDRDGLAEQLDARGIADLGQVLSTARATSIGSDYKRESAFRSRVVMRRHNFGEGEYKYFAYPLPNVIQRLRTELYAALVPTANRWQRQLGTGIEYPDTLDKMLQRCHADGQTKPTPLMLRYEKGGYNCLHQDLYGSHVFPLQVVILLSKRSAFSGGEFVFTEQRPRMQSRATVFDLRQGQALAFAVNERPRSGVRGFHRVKHRHGVSDVHAGHRLTLGIIFHDAA